MTMPETKLTRPAAPAKPALKILQICDRTHDFAKEFNLIEEVARSFPAPDYEFTHCVLADPEDDTLAARMGCAVHSFHMPKRKIRGGNWKLLWALLRYIRGERFDVIITHRFKPWLLVALISPWLPQCRFISLLRAFKQFDRRRRQWLAAIFVNRRWRMVGVSKAVQEDLIAHGIPARHTAVIPNAINVAGIRSGQLPRAAARERLGLDPDALVIGTVGRAHPVKGQKYLIEAFAHIAEEFPAAKLIIIGGGELEDALRRQAAATGLGQRILLPGAINDGFRYLPALDLFVLPSLSEGFGLSIAEAIATRVPVIGSRVGGVPEATGPDGVLVQSRDAGQLAQAMRTVLGWSAAERAAYADKLYQRLVGEYTLAHYHQHYRALVAELMAVE